MVRGFIRSRRGQSRRADFYVCDMCGAVIHGRAGTMHLGVLSHLRMHKRRGEKPPPRSEWDKPEDRQLVRKAGHLAICGMEAVRSLDQAKAVLAGQICTPSIAKRLTPEERDRLRVLGQLQSRCRFRDGYCHGIVVAVQPMLGWGNSFMGFGKTQYWCETHRAYNDGHWRYADDAARKTVRKWRTRQRKKTG